MKLSLFVNIVLLLGSLASAAQFAMAEDKEKKREQVKQELLLPECSWSTMQKQEYDECQKKRSTLKAMTPEERAKYLDATEQGVMTLDNSDNRLRNGALINRAGGVRKGR